MKIPFLNRAVAADSPAENSLFRLSHLSQFSRNDFTSTQGDVDFLVRGTWTEGTDAKSIIPLLAGGFAYRLTRIAVMGSPVKMFGRAPLQAASVVLGTGGEVIAYETVSRTLQSLYRSPVTDHQSPSLWKWNGQGGWKEGGLSSLITFSMFKGAGALSRESNLVFQHALQSTAMVAGHQAAGALKLIPKPEGTLAEQYFHAEATNLKLGATLALAHSVAPGVGALERSFDNILRVGAKHSAPPSAERNASPLQPAWSSIGVTGKGNNERAPWIHLMSSSGQNEGPKNGEGRPPTSVIRTSTQTANEPSLRFEDLSAIHEALLHPVKRILADSENLVPLLTEHAENLKRLNNAIGKKPTGEAPDVARSLAEAIFKEGTEKTDLSHHPIALLVAAALTTHYEAIGDLVGHRIYLDLNRAYRLLQQSSEQNAKEAEKIVLENLARDPFHLWFIHLGKSLSVRLKDEAEQKPPFYDKLLEELNRRHKVWVKTPLFRAIDEKIVGKFRKSFLRGLWDNIGMITLVEKVLAPIFAALILSIPQKIRWIRSSQKLGKDIKNIPSLLKGMDQKTHFEIDLYFGDYRRAASFAEENHPLRRLQAFLDNEQKGESLRQEIVLEDIPHLNPRLARQTEALKELKEQLSRAKVVVLEGIPGSAKTTLAVELAHQIKRDSRERVFWYTFSKGKKPNLLRFLKHLADAIVQGEPLSEAKLLEQFNNCLNLEDKIDVLAKALQRNPTFIFIDNAHLLLEEPEVVSLIQRLTPKGIGDSRIVTIIHKSEEWLKQIGAQVFRREGIYFKEAKNLFQNLSVLDRFTEDQLKEAYVSTRGRPMALGLLAVLVRSGKGPSLEEHLKILSEKENRAQVLKYLFDQIYQNVLSVEQKYTLQYLSIFREAVPREALVFLGQSSEERLQSNLVPLREAFLAEELRPNLYNLHDSIRKLAALHLEDAPEFHHRAGEYYAGEAKFPRDFLEAAHHFFEAREYSRAVRIVSKWIPLLLKRGYAQRVDALLSRFDEKIPLKSEERTALTLARGDLAYHKAEWEKALQFYQKALPMKKRLGEDRGVALLYGKIAQTQDMLGEWKRALNTYEKALRLMRRPEDQRSAASIFHNMGRILHAHGLWEKAHSFYRQSLHLHEQLGDRSDAADVNYDLGLLERDRGNIPKALEFLRRSLEIHREIKSAGISHIEKLIEDLGK